jgi:hypothetical protein
VNHFNHLQPVLEKEGEKKIDVVRYGAKKRA